MVNAKTRISTRSRISSGVPQGGEFAVEAKGENPDLSVTPEPDESPLPQPKLSQASIEYLLGTRYNVHSAFPEGYYTREQFAKLSKALAEDMELIAVWDNAEDDAEGAEIFGRVDGGPWRGLSFEFEDYLTDENQRPMPTKFLWPQAEANQPDLDDLVTTDSHNFHLPCRHLNTYAEESDHQLYCEDCDEWMGPA